MKSPTIPCCLMFGLALVAICGACVVAPVPAPSRTTAPPDLREVDLGSIRPGSTTRHEVEERLGWSDVGFHSDIVFIGRWSSSSSATLWFAAGGSEGIGDAKAGSGRNWVAHTLLVKFDEKGVVRSSRLVPDRDLIKEFSEVARRDPAKRTYKAPYTVYVNRREGSLRFAATMTLCDDKLQFGENGAHQFDISRTKIRAFSVPKLAKSEQKFPEEMLFTIHFSEKTRIGSEMTVYGRPADLITMIYYKEQTR